MRMMCKVKKLLGALCQLRKKLLALLPHTELEGQRQ